MIKYLIFLLFIIPLSLCAQISISGKVTDLSSNKPIENASVILSNSTVGNKTTADGSFILKNVKPGQYDLVASIVGYETYHLTLTVNNANLIVPPIQLLPKSVTLNEVVIKPDANWARNFDIFKRELLGVNTEGQQCKILNPDVVQLNYEAKSRKLTASSYDFMEIENRALGYKIKYLLTNFVDDFAGNMIYFEGSLLFEDMKTTSARQQKQWNKAREKAYYGSLPHFLRSALQNQCEAAGFKTLQLVRKSNPDRQPEDLIKSKLAYFRTINTPAAKDSLNKWINEKWKPTNVSYLVKTPTVDVYRLINRTDEKGIYALSYADLLYVMYTKKHDSNSNNLSTRSLDIPNYPTTIIRFDQPYAFFDANGSVTNPTSMTFEGAWGKSRLAGMLPVDYEPEQ
ncbi:carboxypeptidase-like regulatory domain-containing protein [Mucilaginibacter agri]|uniref:Carboxypeptidase-like regulatory domain-containing protein n=1 Tax=Mucilaginibacter agri TaxID=2695265 RepID=A0A965ZBF9_9SPHI|nr:carboxypeptidase-like regulatory domain-containing protein [Mucilaginibacter agri]NCD67954.1 hypothetical protein [Mucilaginibacter agri]